MRLSADAFLCIGAMMMGDCCKRRFELAALVKLALSSFWEMRPHRVEVDGG